MLTADDIYREVRRAKPTGWKRFTPEMAQRVATTMTRPRLQAVGVLLELDSDTQLTEDSYKRLAEDVRTHHGQVGGLATAIIGWVAWQLVQAAVLYALKWAWRRRGGN